MLLGDLGDPSDTLGLFIEHADTRCFGWAPSKGRKCRNPIQYANFMDAKLRLARLGQLELWCLEADLLKDIIAGQLLCVKNHQYQKNDMVRAWNCRIRRAEDAFRARHRPASHEVYPGYRPAHVVPTTHRLQRQHTRLALPPIPREQPDEHSHTPSPDVRLLQRPVDGELPTPEASDDEDEAEDGEEYEHQDAAEREENHVEDEPEADHTDDDDEEDDEEAQGDVHTVLPTPPRTPEPVLDPTSPPAQNSDTPRCRVNHARRRPLDDICYVCHCPMELTEDLVWCKSGCGKSLHKDCWADWELLRPSPEDRLTCMICKATWIAPCEHDSQRPHIQLESEEDLASVTLADVWHQLPESVRRLLLPRGSATT